MSRRIPFILAILAAVAARAYAADCPDCPKPKKITCERAQQIVAERCPPAKVNVTEKVVPGPEKVIERTITVPGPERVVYVPRENIPPKPQGHSFWGVGPAWHNGWGVGGGVGHVFPKGLTIQGVGFYADQKGQNGSVTTCQDAYGLDNGTHPPPPRCYGVPYSTKAPQDFGAMILVGGRF